MSCCCVTRSEENSEGVEEKEDVDVKEQEEGPDNDADDAEEEGDNGEEKIDDDAGAGYDAKEMDEDSIGSIGRVVGDNAMVVLLLIVLVLDEKASVAGERAL